MPSTLDLPSPDWTILRQKLPAHATRDEQAKRIAELEAGMGVAKAGILARNKMIERDRAQLILQDLYLRKQQLALNTKSGKKKSKNKQMKSDGRGRHLTDVAYIQEKRKFVVEKKKEKRAKAKRLQDREAKRIAKEKAEERWKTYFKDWKQKDSEWRAQTRGVPKSQQPPKPTRMLKPDFISSAIEEELVRLEEEAEAGDSSEEDGDDESDWESAAEVEDGEEGEEDGN